MGKRGSGPGGFQLPHNIVVDARDRVYVTDRDNRRVEIFDAKELHVPLAIGKVLRITKLVCSVLMHTYSIETPFLVRIHVNA